MDEIDRAILIELDQNPPPSIREIGYAIRRSHVYVLRRLNVLRVKGLVSQRTARMARAYVVTDAGRNATKY
jgi:DNA-binding Lrp family transcriptional regulator